jgi:hypothetical protein
MLAFFPWTHGYEPSHCNRCSLCIALFVASSLACCLLLSFPFMPHSVLLPLRLLGYFDMFSVKKREFSIRVVFVSQQNIITQMLTYHPKCMSSPSVVCPFSSDQRLLSSTHTGEQPLWSIGTHLSLLRILLLTIWSSCCGPLALCTLCGKT